MNEDCSYEEWLAKGETKMAGLINFGYGNGSGYGDG